MIHINLKNTLTGAGKQCPQAVVQPAGLPKSLGELCLEAIEDGLRYWAIRFDNTIFGDVRAELTESGRDELHALRCAMWHKSANIGEAEWHLRGPVDHNI